MAVRRAAVALLGAGLAAGTVAGCANTLHNRQLIAYFRPGTPTAVLQTAARVCGQVVPGITPLDAPRTDGGGSAVGLSGSRELTFRIGAADDRAVAELTDCLHRQPGVVGVQIPDDSMS